VLAQHGLRVLQDERGGLPRLPALLGEHSGVPS
jgi:hypothetical protein